MRVLQLLLLFLPVALLAHFAGIGEIFVFAASALAIIPLAKILGEATEVLAEKAGPRAPGATASAALAPVVVALSPQPLLYRTV